MSDGDGQALLVRNGSSADQMKVSFQDSTIKGNLRAIELDGADALILLINSVLASENSANNCVFGGGTASLHPLSKVNLDTGHSCQGILGAPSWTDTNPGLAWFGGDGWHRFYIPQLNEFVIDRDQYCASTDLIGRPRPIDGDGDGSALCDLGAVEAFNTSSDIFADGFEQPPMLLTFNKRSAELSRDSILPLLSTRHRGQPVTVARAISPGVDAFAVIKARHGTDGVELQIQRFDGHDWIIGRWQPLTADSVELRW